MDVQINSWGRRSRLVIIVLLAILVKSPVTAQSALFDTQELSAACSQNECRRGLQSVLGRLKSQNLSDDIFNSQIGIIAALLLNVGQSQTAPLNNEIAQDLFFLSGFSTDIAQRDGIERAATALHQSDLALLATAEPYAVSPDRPRRRRFTRPRGWRWLRFFGLR